MYHHDAFFNATNDCMGLRFFLGLRKSARIYYKSTSLCGYNSRNQPVEDFIKNNCSRNKRIFRTIGRISNRQVRLVIVKNCNNSIAIHDFNEFF